MLLEINHNSLYVTEMEKDSNNDFVRMSNVEGKHLVAESYSGEFFVAVGGRWHWVNFASGTLEPIQDPVSKIIEIVDGKLGIKEADNAD